MLSSRLRRYLVWSAIAAALVGIYAAAGYWGVPHLLRSSLQNFVATHYQRKLSLGEIRFNPFNLRLDVRDLSLPDRDAQPMLGFGHLQVALQIASLWRRAPSFRNIELEQPFARLLIRSDGTPSRSPRACAFSSTASPWLRAARRSRTARIPRRSRRNCNPSASSCAISARLVRPVTPTPSRGPQRSVNDSAGAATSASTRSHRAVASSSRICAPAHCGLICVNLCISKCPPASSR